MDFYGIIVWYNNERLARRVVLYEKGFRYTALRITRLSKMQINDEKKELILKLMIAICGVARLINVVKVKLPVSIYKYFESEQNPVDEIVDFS